MGQRVLTRWARSSSPTASRSAVRHAPTARCTKALTAPHHVTLAFRLRSVGKGKHFMPNAGGILQKVVGGWAYNSSMEYMTGTPTGRPDAFPTCATRNCRKANRPGPAGSTLVRSSPTETGPIAPARRAGHLDAVADGYQLRSYDDRFRTSEICGLPRWNISMLRISRSARMVNFQFRAEAFATPLTRRDAGADTETTSNNFGGTTIAQRSKYFFFFFFFFFLLGSASASRRTRARTRRRPPR